MHPFLIMSDIHSILNKKTELLCKGLYLDENMMEYYRSEGIQVHVRKGGAGPSGGKYFLLEDNETLVNVALWNDPKRTNLVLKEKRDGLFQVYDKYDKGHFCDLKLIDAPKFYEEETTDGIQMKKIALVHGTDCLASTIYQKCRYWACGQACIFCAIELSLDEGATILEKTPEQMVEVVSAARSENRCSHMTLTSGTTLEDDKGVRRYIDMVSKLKEKHSDIPLHVQIEPTDDMAHLEALKEAGADTIGIHLEVLDPVMRMIITPGKSKIPIEQYETFWTHAVELFGKNQVDTFILTGFGESRYDFIEDLSMVIEHGVIPYITPVRAVPTKKGSEMPTMNHNALLEIYSNAARMMKEHGINPLENKAGCVRCGGCSAITEAYKALKN